MIRTLARDDGTMATAVFGRRALTSETRLQSSPVHRVDVVDLVPNAMAEDVSLALVTGTCLLRVGQDSAEETETSLPVFSGWRCREAATRLAAFSCRDGGCLIRLRQSYT
ncbi:hypothetical protein CCHR01_12020 [Colletotrichum chrysophilum]|uniref:Uncharacterized protein n=1 Tax=Colletotrichum chrysophilum TaxID=1836956 RepID=A0AAD9AC26_9PEZI|nr:hypothetical protein CCHR01_12020 [Colletotrichum chrysophilum]